MFYFEDIKLSNDKTVKVMKSTFLDGVEHFFTTRDFVLTQGSLDNLKNEAEGNRALLCEFFGIPLSKLHIPQQVHSANIKSLKEADNDLTNCDAVVSDLKGSCILLNFADCTPIIIFDKKHKTGAVVHAGWRGTAQKILPKTVNYLQKNFSINPKDLTCAIGAAIGACCYCVDENVYSQIIQTIHDSEAKFAKKINDKYYVDLKKINEAQLREAFVENIDVCDFCTSCQNDLFFSYRKEKGKTARHSAILKI